MNVGLFFGSFNPIHNGHINIAQDILDSGEVDEIWMVLSPKSPDKNLILDVFSRYSLMQIALDNMHNIEISKIEFDMPTPNYTYHTLIKLSKKFPKIHFKIIMGQDNYDKINSKKSNAKFIGLSSGGLMKNYCQKNMFQVIRTHILYQKPKNPSK